jgi:hypothetical protein
MVWVISPLAPTWLRCSWFVATESRGPAHNSCVIRLTNRPGMRPTANIAKRPPDLQGPFRCSAVTASLPRRCLRTAEMTNPNRYRTVLLAPKRAALNE